MIRSLCAALLGVAVLAPAQAADVGVSISVGQPGFYGRIDIGNMPQPVLVYPQPVVIQPVPVTVQRQPIYLHVPPGHAKDWRKHCARYGACNQPVYFVQDQWYQQVYVPQYRERYAPPGHDRDDDRRGKGKGKGKDHGHGHGRGHDKD
ncbi:MAG: hypothetical protein E6Q93_30405 [Burkholderiaceae bacterium]|nr:MAG: hypothetical protein E6Q93_30405 [Burkholderiaceae bacterium]